ncbi:hypothetical protein KPL74_08915 [Bacillus sp. NP157]|nr:hypothetical protein KPL74_08915 [Bacillus sp. NP157]
MAAKAYSSAFDSTDPDVVMALANMQSVTRTVLVLFHIDPSLARGVERDRLRVLVKLVMANPGNDLIGFALNALHAMWARGFPVGAFDDDTRLLLDVTGARSLVTGLRKALGTCWANPGWERDHVERVLLLLGYEESDAQKGIE